MQRAVLLQREGRHLLLCGDPIAAVEVIAAPSTRQLERVAFCLLDADERTQAQRLEGRGDPAALLVHHHAFAEWMRRQATDPTHMLDVVSSAGWSEMTWSRVPVVAHRWVMHIIDTTASDRVQVAAAVKSWISAALSGSVPTIDPRVD